MGKVSFVVGVGVGYVLGARAGRRRYEQIKAQAGKVWKSDPVQDRVGAAAEAAKTKAAPFVTDKLGDAVVRARLHLPAGRRQCPHRLLVDPYHSRCRPTATAGRSAAPTSPEVVRPAQSAARLTLH